MKTIISLALLSILVLPSCKKSEIQDIKPAKQSSGETSVPQKEPLVNNPNLEDEASVNDFE
jgi:hypothetical protein